MKTFPLLLSTLPLVLSFSPRASLRLGDTRTGVQMSAATLLKPGSIVQFEEGARPRLGVIRSSNGAKYEVQDADDAHHTVESKQLQIAFPPSAKDVARMELGATTCEMLRDYTEVSRTSSTELGVGVDDLELAWKICENEEASTHFEEYIIAQISETLFEGCVNQYKAFRLLSSDLGKIFFESVPGDGALTRKYKARSTADVEATKDGWCMDEGAHVTGPDEWCFL